LRLGSEGSGYSIALSNLEAGRIGVAAQSVGMAQAALTRAAGYARERSSFGKPIFEHQAVGFRLADLATRLEAARQLVLSAAALKDAGVAVPHPGLDGQAVCVRDCRGGGVGRHPNAGRVRIPGGVRTGEDLQGRSTPNGCG